MINIYQRGYELLPQHPVQQREGKIGPKSKNNDEPELDDDEMINQDLVKGLLRMNLLNRLRYLTSINPTLLYSFYKT